MNIKIVGFVIWALQIQSLHADRCDAPCLYVATVQCILRMQLNQSTGLAISTPEFVTTPSGDIQIRGLELDLKNGHLYWGNLVQKEIIQFSLNEGFEKKLFNYAIGYPIGLAVDWTSNILYWVDSLMKLIETSTTEGQYRKVLFKLKGDAEPRGIVLHPAYGYLFWTDWGVLAKIERASLAGTNRITLVSDNIVWPNDLAIDYDNNILYWIDAYLDVLASVDINGNNRKVIKNLDYIAGKPGPHPFSLLFFQSKFYISDWTDDSVYSLALLNNTISNVEKTFQLDSDLKSKDFMNIGQIRMFKGWHKTLSPCSFKGNNCSHLCFTLSPTHFSCGCPTGMILSKDNFTCTNALKHFEIYFADSGMKSIYHLVKYMNQDGFTIKPLAVPVEEGLLGHPVAIDYDATTGNLYWTDTESQKTYQMNLNASELKIVINHKDHASIGLAIDDVSRLMFFFDQVADDSFNLVVSDMDGNNQKTLLLNLINPQDIEYYDGYVFYSDLGSQIIGRINSDGSGLITLKNSGYFPLKATGLAIDNIEKRLYWCDQDSHLIESSDFNFLQRRKIIQKTVYFHSAFWLVTDLGEVLDPFDLTIHQENIFWTDLKKQAIYIADKRSGGNIEYVTGGLNEPRGILITGDIPHEELRKVYTFSFNLNPDLKKSVNCYSQPLCSGLGNISIPSPQACPLGYKETNYGYSCSNCSDAFGANFKCPCTDWKTCAQRGYAEILGCSPETPFIEFKVRECAQVVKAGVCPYEVSEKCLTNSKSCLSDEDCSSLSKCCESKCGSICVPFLEKSDHPCTVNNGGCSHLCLSSSKWQKCDCPDGMELNQNGKECRSINSTKCEIDLCQNGGSCSDDTERPKCLCVDDWFGSFCQLYTRPHLVTVQFQVESTNVSKESVVTAFAFFFSDYCANYQCTFATEIRNRRLSSPMSVLALFNEDSFYIPQFEYQDTRLTMVFAVVSDVRGVMTRESVDAGLKNFSDSLENELQLKIVNYGYLNNKLLVKKSKSNSVIITAIICLFIMMGILIMLFIFVKLKRRPVQPGNVVQWSFGSQQCTDDFPHEVSLPTEASSNTLSYTNPMFNATNYDNLKNYSGVQIVTQTEDFKKEPQQWVQFTEEDEPKKYPITDFVTPSLDSDMTHSLGLHENQFNIPFIEEVNTDFFPTYVNPSSRYESENLMQSITSLGTPRTIQIASSENFSEANENENAYNC